MMYSELPDAEMEKVSGNRGTARANFPKLCLFLVFALDFKNMFEFCVCNFWQFYSFLQFFKLFLHTFVVLIFQA